MESRREILKKITMCAAVVSTGGVGIRNEEVRSFFEKTSSSKTPFWLLSPMKEGTHVGHNWHIKSLSPIERGATVLTLINSNLESARIHICSHQGNPQGVASTKLFDLILMDGGTGRSPTKEDLGRVILGIAGQIKNREQDLLEQAEQIGELQTHEERLVAYKNQGLT